MTGSRQLLGFLLAAAIAIAFAGNTAAARIAFDDGAAPVMMTAARIAMAGLVVLLVLLISGVPARLPRRSRHIAWALGPLMFFYQFALLSALDYIPLALAILIFYTFPIMTSLYSWAAGHERPTLAGAGAVIIAFTGLILALDVSAGGLNMIGVGLAGLAALGVTTMLQFNYRLVGSGDSRPVTLHILGAATLTGILVILLSGDFALPGSLSGWTAFTLSTLMFSFAIIGMFVAVTMIGPLRTALTMNLEPVASMLLGMFLLSQPMTNIQILGGALVILAVLMVRLATAPRQQGETSHG